MIKAVIIEDNPQAQESLKTMLTEHCPEIEVLDVAGSIDKAISRVRELNPDMVFLDIEFPGEQNGFHFLEETKPLHYLTVFTTGFDKYAIQAIKFSAVDYLVKPVGTKELREAVNRIHTKISQEDNWHEFERKALEVARHNWQQLKKDPILAISSAKDIRYNHLGKVIYFKGDNNMPDAIIEDGSKVKSCFSLTYFQGLLEDHDFLRVHKSYLVNKHHVKKYVRNGRTGKGKLIMSNGDEIPVSRDMRSDMFKHTGVY